MRFWYCPRRPRASGAPAHRQAYRDRSPPCQCLLEAQAFVARQRMFLARPVRLDAGPVHDAPRQFRHGQGIGAAFVVFQQDGEIGSSRSRAFRTGRKIDRGRSRIRRAASFRSPFARRASAIRSPPQRVDVGVLIGELFRQLHFIAPALFRLPALRGQQIGGRASASAGEDHRSNLPS